MTKANLEQLIDLKKEIKEIEQKIRHEGISPSDNVELLEKRKQMAAELEKEITKYINSVVDSRVRRIMQYKYVDGYTWSKIARIMHYDRSSPEKIVTRYLNLEENFDMINEQVKELSKLYDTALEYDIDIQTTADTIVEYRVKMFDKKDSRILKSIIPLLDTLIYEANQYKEWIEQMANTSIYLEDGNIIFNV